MGAPHGQPEPIPHPRQELGSRGGVLGQPQPRTSGNSLGTGWCQGGKSPMGWVWLGMSRAHGEAAMWWEQWTRQRPRGKEGFSRKTAKPSEPQRGCPLSGVARTLPPGSPGQRGWQWLCCLSVDPEPRRANLYERCDLRTCTWRSNVMSKCYNPEGTRKK